ncbi:MAG TPA: dTDP-4-dehydrorhamnose reductase [Alcaligenes faecalis]|nr:dTDP-4-dehydrorhamnose reductase [Alcaligenes faecalis]
MPSPTILISGAQGQLGQALSWIDQQRHPSSIVLLGRSELDITQPDSIARALDLHRPDILINAAAYTAVDKAESEPEAARLINGVAPGLLAQACATRGIGMLHVSTDYVFDGKAAEPYAEDAPTGPVSVYGSSKLQGEQAVLTTLPSAVVLRTSWIFSQFGHNFLKTMLRLGRERKELSVVADQVGGPSYAPHIAQVLLNLAARMHTAPGASAPACMESVGLSPDDTGTTAISGEKHSPLQHRVPSGIYHFAGQPAVSWHEFAQEIFHQAVALGVLDHAPTLTPIRTEQYPTPAQRPAQSGLSQDKLDELLGANAIVRDWRDGVRHSLLAL